MVSDFALRDTGRGQEGKFLLIREKQDSSMAKLEGNSTTMDHLPTKTFLITAIVLKCLLAVVGITGNVAAIIHILIKHVKTPADYLIINLAIADLTTCVTYYPTYAIEFGRIVSGVGINQDLFCKASFSIGSSSVALSILTLLAITFDRFYFITYPLKYPLVMTKKRVLGIIAVVWFSALFLASCVAYFTTSGLERFDCFADYTLTILGFAIFVYIPTAFVLYLNYKMFKVARYHRRRIAQQSEIARSGVSQSENTDSHRITARASFARTLKSIKTFAIVTALFVLCYIPYSTTLIVEKFLCHEYCVPLELFILLGDLVSLGSVLNPFIYNIRENRR